MRALTALVGALLEAWQEVRVHRTRVLLSLVGVAVAVCSLTTVVALGAIVQQSTMELSERSSGRPATLVVSMYGGGGDALDPARVDAAWAEVVDRYGVTYASRVQNTTQVVPFPDGLVDVGTQAVDQPYGEMHRVQMREGEWFTPLDAQQLAPQIIVNEVFWDRMGRPPLSTHPVVALGGQGVPNSASGIPSGGVRAVVVGVTPSPTWDTMPSMFMLADHAKAIEDAATGERGTSAAAAPDPYGGGYGPQTQYEMWVPPELSEQLTGLVQRDLVGALGEGSQVDINRQDWATYGEDPFAVTRNVVIGIAVLVLLLGALGLVNIALVTVKQRVREIGIRRSFGATASRVFFAVMMESVVATVVAGGVGVIVSILVVQSPAVRDLVGQGMVSDFPPFPVDAAITGLVAATVVGALAGLLPALVAVRVKVIDAIRY
ncbi:MULTISPECIES: ABC transporter permease [Microbacterium]|uniref:ABC transporter permease n=1 Tax=Microbacterium TaxID=33882 RepID=UPI002789EF6B|nr:MULTISPECIES: ABC transporter permease [Microbacterium]MDQ1084546.1 putative ABC transport system permease protein [Microbacterium sp. SORGH_AS_0344]MDQ1170176.1 putative ABC transport system permease protein [Microbacterium proteolyticum]